MFLKGFFFASAIQLTDRDVSVPMQPEISEVKGGFTLIFRVVNKTVIIRLSLTTHKSPRCKCPRVKFPTHTHSVKRFYSCGRG